MPVVSAGEVIERGEGLRPYRPRKAPAALLLDDGCAYVIAVLRTHDLDVAERLARDAWRREIGDDLTVRSPRKGWTRVAPWDPSGQFDRAYIDVPPSDRRAMPCVWIET